MKRENSGQHVRLVVGLIFVGAAASILLSVRSYSYSDHLTYSDVNLSTDEGLCSIMVPLARLAPGHEAVNNWQTYTLQRANVWTADRWVTASGGTKFKIREYVEMLGKRGNDESLSSGMACGFGYVFVDATWTSDSRPGPLLWLIAPVWAVAAISTAAIGVPLLLRARFGMRSLMVFITIAAVILLLPTLHAPS